MPASTGDVPLVLSVPFTGVAEPTVETESALEPAAPVSLSGRTVPTGTVTGPSTVLTIVVAAVEELETTVPLRVPFVPASVVLVASVLTAVPSALTTVPSASVIVPVGPSTITDDPAPSMVVMVPFAAVVSLIPGAEVAVVDAEPSRAEVSVDDEVVGTMPSLARSAESAEAATCGDSPATVDTGVRTLGERPVS